MADLASDDFNRASLGANWTVLNGGWTIASNHLQNSSNGGPALVTYTALAARADLKVTLTRASASTFEGGALIAVDADNHYFIDHFNGFAGVELYRTSGGSRVSIESFSSAFINNGDTCTLEREVGPSSVTLRVYVNGSLLGEYVDSDAARISGDAYAGAAAFVAAGTEFDDLLIEDLEDDGGGGDTVTPRLTLLGAG